jgi:hypothetical protein
MLHALSRKKHEKVISGATVMTYNLFSQEQLYWVYYDHP